jgi:hypothetical protein
VKDEQGMNKGARRGVDDRSSDRKPRCGERVLPRVGAQAAEGAWRLRRVQVAESTMSSYGTVERLAPDSSTAAVLRRTRPYAGSQGRIVTRRCGQHKVAGGP